VPKAKVLLVPKLKPKPPTSHLEDQKRRMEWVRNCKAAEDDDDSLVQVASKVAKKGEGSQGVWGFLEDDKEPSGDGDGDGAGEEKQKQPEGDGDADEDEQGYADLARAVPTKFLLQELAQRCTR
jgi:hypothetical protein